MDLRYNIIAGIVRMRQVSTTFFLSSIGFIIAGIMFYFIKGILLYLIIQQLYSVSLIITGVFGLIAASKRTKKKVKIFRLLVFCSMVISTATVVFFVMKSIETSIFSVFPYIFFPSFCLLFGFVAISVSRNFLKAIQNHPQGQPIIPAYGGNQQIVGAQRAQEASPRIDPGNQTNKGETHENKGMYLSAPDIFHPQVSFQPYNPSKLADKPFNQN